MLPRRGPRGRWSRRCWRRTPTRSRRSTSSSSPTRGTSRTAAPAGSATVEPTTLAEFADRGGRRAAARPPTASGSPATPTRPVRRVAVCGGAGDFLLDAVAGDRRRRLRHQRPAAPPGERVPREGRARPWSTSRTGRPSGPGCRWSRRGWPRRLGDTVETRVSTDRHRPVDLPGLRRTAPEEPPLKADPVAQLKLLDVQELDSRARPAAAPARHAARAGRDRRAAGQPRAALDDQRARRPDPGRRPDRRAAQGRRRRRAGQGPPRPATATGWTRA